MERAVPEGKHLRVGGAPYRVKGVTYGHFAPRGDGWHFPGDASRSTATWPRSRSRGSPWSAPTDVPPPDLLDAARALGLRLLVGLRYDDWRMHAGGVAEQPPQVRRDGQPRRP